MWNTIRTIGTARHSVALQWRYETDSDLSWCDAATLAGIERGDYAPYCFRVIVLRDCYEIGADYLGDSIYSDPCEFAREHYGIARKGREDGVTYCCYFPSMVRAAIAKARNTLKA